MRNPKISLPWVRQGFTTKQQHTKRLVWLHDLKKVSQPAKNAALSHPVIGRLSASPLQSGLTWKRSVVRIHYSPPILRVHPAKDEDCNMKVRKINVDRGVAFGDGSLTFIAGPCVIESRRMALDLAARLVEVANDLSVNYVFKASFDKANRTSVDSFRGPGIDAGLDILAEIRETFEVPVLTDVHEPWQCARVAEVCDVLQIPAFLARQTDLVVAAGETGAVVNVKKGQFMAPEDMANVVRKIESTGNRRIVLCERGASFGYRNLVADMRSLLIMRDLGYPVIFDATHSVQRPGGLGTGSGGDGKYAPALARAAVATGVDGVFMETHVNPKKALSDAANAIPFREVKALWKQLLAIHGIVRG